MSFLSNLFHSTSLSSLARKTGYVKDQMGIQNRYVRENAQWKSHLEQTKAYIVASAKNISSNNSVAVLGSGWLLDVPLEELSKAFRNVYLFDIVHPETVRVKAQKMANVYLQTIDLTGGAVQLAEQSHSFEAFLLQLRGNTLDVDFNQYDFVVSVNLLNQLDIILCDYLKNKFSLQDEDLKEVRKIVQQRHINCLPKGKTCLVTDYCEENTSVTTGEVSTKQLLYCSLPNVECTEWIWTFDTNQMYHKGYRTCLKVKAMKI